jgi:alpha-N-arabinofuranosidase
MVDNFSSISFSKDKKIADLSNHMFGTNLEHIGDAIYRNGIWAEIIKNRKFCGPDKLMWNNGLEHDHLDFGIIQPWKGYNASAKHVMYAHSNSEYITKGNEVISRYGSGKQSQQITIREKSSINRGIQQDIYITDTKDEFDFSIITKGENQKIFIEIGEVKLSFFTKKNWYKFKKKIKFKKHNSNKKISISIHSGNIYIANCSLMPKDTIYGFRKDITEMIKEWTPSYIRWPGGNFLSGYNWQNGIGNKDHRLPYYDHAWYQWEDNDVGTDEFLKWCEYIGSEPMITVNTGDGSIEDAQNWLEYITGSPSTKFGNLRTKNGRKKPYKLETIFIGNEMFGGWQIGHTDPITYAKKYDKFVKALKKINYKFRFIAVGACSDHFGHWNELVLKNIKEKIDELSVHYYSIRTEKDKNPPNYKTRYLPTVAASTEVRIMLDRTIREIKKYSDKNIKIAFDEWNTYVEAHTPYFIENYNIADAIYAASLLHACINRGDIIRNTGIYHLINVMGNYQIDKKKVWKSPTTLVLELFSKYHKGSILKTNVKTDKFISPKLGKQPSYKNNKMIDASATFYKNQICLSIVNKSENKNIQLKSPYLEKIYTTFTINGESKTDLNSYENNTKVKIKRNVLKIKSNIIILPPHSINLIIFKNC